MSIGGNKEGNLVEVVEERIPLEEGKVAFVVLLWELHHNLYNYTTCLFFTKKQSGSWEYCFCTKSFKISGGKAIFNQNVDYWCFCVCRKQLYVLQQRQGPEEVEESGVGFPFFRRG